MLPATRRTVDRWMQALLHIHDTPQRTAAAFALGVALGFGPFVGLHSAIGITLAFLFNLNRVAVLAGLWVNLPWIMGPYYAAVTIFGAWLIGAPLPTHVLTELHATLDLPTWRERGDALAALIKPLLVPYTVGSAVCAVPIGFTAYGVTLAFLRARRRKPPTTPDSASGSAPRS